MEPLSIEEISPGSCWEEPSFTIDSYEGEQPRWCKGCGDFSILVTLERLLSLEKIPPQEVVCVSGIGCSSRFPYYLKTFGFHGIHGRALPISTGVALANKNLKVFTVMGDGDCFSIGMGHWIHALRYNTNMTVLVFDNEIYGLTKKQTSPTTPLETSTRTTPAGPYIAPLKPLALMLGATGTSFVAQTATWLPAHMLETLQKAQHHQGLSFVRILQRCPMFSPQAFCEGGHDASQFVFLEHEAGIPVPAAVEKSADHRDHNPLDLAAAQELARTEGREPLGLLFHSPQAPTYNHQREAGLKHLSPQEKIDLLNQKLDQFAP